MHLSKKLNCIVNFWLHFWSLRLILIVLENKFEPHSLCFLEIVDGEKRAYVNV